MSREAVVCPECRGPLVESDPQCLSCLPCGETYQEENGVWSFLSRSRREEFARFLEEYTRIRHEEGRGSDEPGYYRNLPDCDPTHPLAWQWRIRGASYRVLAKWLSKEASLDVADLGAGVGWLSHRLVRQGHRPVAVDLSLDEQDGLLAARHFEVGFPCYRADFDRLPFAAESLDLVVFNASFHYSRDYRVTLREALRILRPDGTIVVLDTPVYLRRESGEQMVAERHAWFEKTYGFRSDALPSREFLTDTEIDDLERELGIHWTIDRPWLGFAWALRPIRAFLKQAREPSRFLILYGRRAQAD